MHIEPIENTADFYDLKQAWQSLCDDLGDSVTVFACFEWYELWWRHYSAQANMHLLAMRDGNKLVGVAPLMLRRATVHGLPATVICFIENNLSLHNDFIVLPAFRELFLTEVSLYLFAHQTQLDAIVFNNLPATSANYDTLVKILDDTDRQWRQNPTWFDSPYLVPSGTWAD